MLIPISAKEMAELLREGRERGEPLDVAFGTGGAAVKADKSPWTVPLLAQWRGVTVSDGAGI